LSCPFNLFLDFITGKADYNYCNTWRDSIVSAFILFQKGKSLINKNQTYILPGNNDEESLK
jgi:hypothetical protein